jgi:hypothetical protein
MNPRASISFLKSCINLGNRANNIFFRSSRGIESCSSVAFAQCADFLAALKSLGLPSW